MAAVILFSTIPAHGQGLRHLWTGLRDAQPEEQLPKGKTPPQAAERVIKKNIPTGFRHDLPGEWVFESGWEMADDATLIESGKSVFDLSLDTSEWYNATVPGTVLTTLVEQGVYPDPYFGLNNMAIPDTLCRTEWWYRNIFELPLSAAQQKRIRLAFDGINYIAEVYLNGHRLGSIEGAFMRGEFDITDHIDRNGKNVLAVKILPPRNPGIPHEQSVTAGQGLNGGALSLDGPTFISSMGWDWIPGIRDRNTGIWQDVRILAGGDVAIGDPLVTTRLPYLPDTTRATVTIMIPVRNMSDKPVSGKVEIKLPVQLSREYALAAGESAELIFSPGEYRELNIKKPRLWWPNGYGNPELYELYMEIYQEGEFSDSKSLKFGIRELSYELMVATPDEGRERVLYTPSAAQKPGRPVFDYVKRVNYDRYNQLPTFADGADMSAITTLPADDPIGPYLTLRVNGVRIFCRGGNWGMDDGMKRSGRERLEPYVKLHREAGFNIIRNWTGESTQKSFYELCDEYGMLVWNDFWITTDDTVEPMDVQLFVRNARDVVRRFRNHASIAVWCPRNEGFAPRDMEKLLPAMMAEEDPARHYHGQSRFLNMDGSGPWGFYKDPSKYYTDNAKGFITEIGTYAVPTAQTIRKFIGEADLWPINDVWAYHDLHHTTQNFPDFMAAVERYGEPRGMEDFARQSQQVCYDAWRAIIEAWNSRMWNNTTGQILWMSHPAWPSMIWQTYTYDYETPGSYFGAKKACEPLHVQMNLDNGKVVIINSTRENRKNLTVKAEAFDPSTGKIFYTHSGKFTAMANSLTECFIPELPEKLPELYLMRISLYSSGKAVSVNDYWITASETSYERMNRIGPAEVKTLIRKTKKGYDIEVTNYSDMAAIGVKLNAVDDRSGEIILPAYFSDGYFNLLPGEKRTVALELPREHKNGFVIMASGYNL